MLSPSNAASLLATSGTTTAGIAGNLAGASGRVGHMTPGQIDKVSKDFESMFVGQMVEQMFGDSMGSEAFGDHETADIYKGMMADAYGKEIAQSGGIGIASYVKNELLKLQEVQSAPGARLPGTNQVENKP